MSARILAIGGAHLDRRGRLEGPVVPAASNPGRWREEAGGGAFNAAAMLARLGHSVRLVAPRGGDAAGALVAEAARAAGIEDTPLTFLDRATPSYTAILGPDGDLFVALADMALYDIYGPRQIARRTIREAIAAADAVLTDANLPAATLEALAEACDAAARPLFAIAISPAKAGRLGAVLDRLASLF
ncbi:MAG: PfkB family carbohydrate kinase, partial [Pararhizobium sp.]